MVRHAVPATSRLTERLDDGHRTKSLERLQDVERLAKERVRGK